LFTRGPSPHSLFSWRKPLHTLQGAGEPGEASCCRQSSNVSNQLKSMVKDDVPCLASSTANTPGWWAGFAASTMHASISWAHSSRGGHMCSAVDGCRLTDASGARLVVPCMVTAPAPAPPPRAPWLWCKPARPIESLAAEKRHWQLPSLKYWGGKRSIVRYLSTPLSAPPVRPPSHSRICGGA